MINKKNLLNFVFLFSITLFYISCKKTKENTPIENNTGEEYVDIVPIEFAKIVAEKFNAKTFLNNPNIKSNLNGGNKIKSTLTFNDSYGNPALYLFNYEDNNGFIFVSADFKQKPILAYIESGELVANVALPPTFVEWVNKTKENIEIVRKGLYDNSASASYAWRTYFKQYHIDPPSNISNKIAEDDGGGDAGGCNQPPITITKGPLLPVTWGQGCTYNNLCPNLSCVMAACLGPAYTGCVATAMAQVIRYWKYPATKYNWTTMPLNIGNIEVQKLMKDAGQSVSMTYGCTGSGAYGGNIPGAMKSSNFFKFISANRISYNIGTYITVKSNINFNRPVLLEGFNSQTNVFLGIIYKYGEGHEWVCDGYTSTDIPCYGSTLYFHMNWGWHEAYTSASDLNGYFAFDNWAIYSINRNYQYAREAVVDIYPY